MLDYKLDTSNNLTIHIEVSDLYRSLSGISIYDNKNKEYLKKWIYGMNSKFLYEYKLIITRIVDLIKAHKKISDYFKEIAPSSNYNYTMQNIIDVHNSLTEQFKLTNEDINNYYEKLLSAINDILN